MNYPKELLYTKTHEWIRKTGENKVRIGLTDFAQDSLGDLVFVNLPAVGDQVTAGGSFADVESVKAVSDVFSPVTGKISDVNRDLESKPQKINEEPYGAWIAEVENVKATEDTMDAEAYEKFCGAEGKSE